MSRNKDRLGPSGPEADSLPPQAMHQSESPGFSFVIPTEFVELPSGGRFYTEGHPLHGQDSLEIKQMTAKEEDILTSRALLKEGVALDRMLQSLLLEDGVRIGDLLIGDKNALLVFLRRSHGDREATNAAPKKITLKRKTIGTLKSSSNHGRGKTVNVEVRKKRTYVKRVAEENLDSASTTQEDEENLEKPIPETQEVKSEPKGETKDGEDVAKESAGLM